MKLPALGVPAAASFSIARAPGAGYLPRRRGVGFPARVEAAARAWGAGGDVKGARVVAGIDR
ncbi:MAG: hypothetical protein HY719_12930 [Planctomycetes bacterium]|nr:hypothetical protein [Planctomycetota bacterium]